LPLEQAAGFAVEPLVELKRNESVSRSSSSTAALKKSAACSGREPRVAA